MVCGVNYKVQCDCGAIHLFISGAPIFSAFCHCQECRDLYKMPVSGVVAWSRDDVEVVKGRASLAEYKDPEKKSSRFFCQSCGTTLYANSHLKLSLLSQGVIRQSYFNEMPNELMPDRHIFYADRVLDVNDKLSKYLGGEGELFDG